MWRRMFVIVLVKLVLSLLLKKLGLMATIGKKEQKQIRSSLKETLLFTAKEDEAEYTWYIGQETLTEQSVGRFFDGATAGQNIPVTLVVKKKPNLTCFPQDDGYDSITKYFQVYHQAFDYDTLYINPYPRFYGIFRFKEKYGVDSIDINIDFNYSLLQGGVMIIYNYDGMGSNTSINNYTGFDGCTYRQLWHEISNSWNTSLLYKSNGEVIFNMISFSPVNPESYYYKGRKL